jgi:hypothetical protein
MSDIKFNTIVILSLRFFKFYNGLKKDEDRKEIFRPDIYDKGIIEQTSNTIHFNIPRLIHKKIDHAIWMYKYTDDTFSERLELELSKKNNKYYIV